MDMSRPASLIMPAGTESVLKTLAGTDRPLGVREVARLAGVSANRASQVLAGLIEHGLVMADDHGSGRLCRLNRQHLAARPLLDLIGLRGRLLELVRSEVAAWAPKPLHVSLFGSAARGDGSTASDLDLLVVRAESGSDVEDEGWESQLFASGERLLAATGNHAAWLVITPADLRRAVRAGEPIVREWRRDAIHLAGRRLATLLGQAA